MKKVVVWGGVLWLVGYVLGIVLFPVVPNQYLGWAIMPIGLTLTIWVLKTKFANESFKYYLLTGFVWALMAIIFDYFFLVKLFNPPDGYYKLDVYLYYLLTLLLPLVVGKPARSAYN